MLRYATSYNNFNDTARHVNVCKDIKTAKPLILDWLNDK